MPLPTPGHRFVSEYLKDAKARGYFDQFPAAERWTKSQELTAEAWRIAKERHIVGNPKRRRNPETQTLGSGASGPLWNPETQTLGSSSSGPLFNPLPSQRAYARKTNYGNAQRGLERQIDKVEDAYNRAIQMYGVQHPITVLLAQRLDYLDVKLNKARFNPKMPGDYYAGEGKTSKVPVVVRQYERRLPERKVPSRETIYRRLPNKAEGSLVARRHDTAGDVALKYEIAHHGGPVVRDSISMKMRKNPVMNGGMSMLLGALALGALVMIGRTRNV